LEDLYYGPNLALDFQHMIRGSVGFYLILQQPKRKQIIKERWKYH